MGEPKHTYGSARRALLDNGYDPIPCKGKRPRLTDWQNKVGVPGFDGDNVGLLTARAPALDSDLDDADAAAAVAGVVRGRFPAAPCRHGKGHKCLYLFQLRGPTFCKLRREFEKDGKRGAVEWLAEGQQAVALGIHPDTGQPYRWDGPSPLTAPRDALPAVDEAAARELLADITEALAALGWEPVNPDTGKSSLVRRHDPLPAATFDHLRLTAQERLAVPALRWLDSEDYGSWIAAGMAIKGEGLPFELWLEWSRTAPNFDADACEKRWASFKPHSASLHTLYRAAGLPSAVLDFGPPDELEPQEATRAGGGDDDGIETLADAMNRPPPEWLIKGLIPKRSLVGLIAAPNAGKSFVLLDLCAAIERASFGEDVHWFGRRVRAGKDAIVVVFNYEGSASLRSKAAKKHGRLKDGTRIVYESGWPNLRDPESVAKVIARVRQIEAKLGGKVELVVFDPLNLALAGGDENSSLDMGAAVGGMKRIRDELGTCVLAVHHVGKDDSKGARGHTSFLGALDTEITLDQKKTTKMRTLRASKVRDGETGDFGWFELKVIPMGEDEDGEAITSCAVEPTVEAEFQREVADDFAQRVRAALEPHRAGLTQTELAKAVGVGKNRASEKLRPLVDAGVILGKPGPHNATIYSLATTEVRND